MPVTTAPCFIEFFATTFQRPRWQFPAKPKSRAIEIAFVLSGWGVISGSAVIGKHHDHTRPRRRVGIRSWVKTGADLGPLEVEPIRIGDLLTCARLQDRPRSPSVSPAAALCGRS